MENFCKIGKLEKKEGYDVCRGEKRQGELRYDLTKILPRSHTLGHFHFGNEPELYEVISGKAGFLIQDRKEQNTYLIKAKEKEKVVIPPNFSMRTINMSNSKELIISNWINEKVKNDYNAFKNIQEPTELRPKKFPKELENLDFLTHPEKYKKFLTIENLYKKEGE